MKYVEMLVKKHNKSFQIKLLVENIRIYSKPRKALAKATFLVACSVGHNFIYNKMCSSNWLEKFILKKCDCNETKIPNPKQQQRKTS